MATDHFRYDLLVQDALRSMVRKVLEEAAQEGLPGDHHFLITFRTEAPGVRLSKRMRDRYPEEMTIVLQHQFWDLAVTEHTFEVGLSFGNVPERLLVPFEALTSFVDPSVQFGLKFEVQDVSVEQSANDADPPDLDVDHAGGNVEKLGPLRAVEKPAGSRQALHPVADEPADAPVTPAAAKPKPSSKAAKELAAAPPQEPTDGDSGNDGAKIVSIDAFRKKT